MILGSTVYNTLLDVLRKEKRGKSLSIDEFNRLSVIVNENLYSKYYEYFEESVDGNDSLWRFKTFATTVNLSAGVGSMPSNYSDIIGEPYYTDSGGEERNVDIITSLELSKRNRDYLTQPSTSYPVCVLGGEDSSNNIQIRVYPISITSVLINYLRVANTPFLDYYVNDTTFQPTFIAEGEQNVAIPTGNTYRDGTTGTVALSATVEWEWSDSDLPLIIALFLQEVGITLPDQLLIEAGMTKEQTL